MAVHELDGVLDREDVAAPLPVDLVDHGGERGALPGAGGSGDEHEPAGPLGEPGDDGRQAELLEASDVEGDLADHHRDAAALAEHVAAEAGEVLDPEGEVEFVLRLEPLLLVVREDGVGELHRVLRGEHVGSGGVDDLAVHAKLGPLARCDVEVARVEPDHLLQERAEADPARGALGRRGGPGRVERGLLLGRLGARERAHVAAVSLMTSSSVVMPRDTLSRPSMRSVSIPSSSACARSSSADAPCMMRRRSAGLIGMTS